MMADTNVTHKKPIIYDDTLYNYQAYPYTYDVDNDGVIRNFLGSSIRINSVPIEVPDFYRYYKDSPDEDLDNMGIRLDWEDKWHSKIYPTFTVNDLTFIVLYQMTYWMFNNHIRYQIYLSHQGLSSTNWGEYFMRSSGNNVCIFIAQNIDASKSTYDYILDLTNIDDDYETMVFWNTLSNTGGNTGSQYYDDPDYHVSSICIMNKYNFNKTVHLANTPHWNGVFNNSNAYEMTQSVITNWLKYQLDNDNIYKLRFIAMLANYWHRSDMVSITKTYINSTWNTNKTWYIKTTISKKSSSATNATGNVVNYDTIYVTKRIYMNILIYLLYTYIITY
jgi:hypothetical protein